MPVWPISSSMNTMVHNLALLLPHSGQQNDPGLLPMRRRPPSLVILRVATSMLVSILLKHLSYVSDPPLGQSGPVRIDPRLPVKLTLGEGDLVHFTIGEPF